MKKIAKHKVEDIALSQPPSPSPSPSSHTKRVCDKFSLFCFSFS